MQLVKTHRDTLLRPLQIVSGIVERRHTLPILANILIRKEGEKVSFLSTDIEVQITTHAQVGSGGEVVGDHRGRAQAARHPARPAGNGRRVAVAGQQAHDGAIRQIALCAADAGGRRISDGRAGRAFQRQGDAAAKNPEAPVQHGAFRDGAAGHPLLPERPAAGGRRQERDRGRHRRPPPGVLPGRHRTGIRAPGSHHPAQDHPRTAAPAGGKRRAGRNWRSPTTR